MARKIQIIDINKFNKAQKEAWDEVEDFLHTYAKTFCKHAAEEITKTAESTIEAFYNDYDPKWYHRTGYIKDSYHYYYHDNGRRVYGGVRIDAKDMKTYKKRVADGWIDRDPWLVMESVWEGGWHGIYGYHTEERMTPTPLEIVQEKMNDQKFISELDKLATQAAKSKSYKHIPLK